MRAIALIWAMIFFWGSIRAELHLLSLETYQDATLYEVGPGQVQLSNGGGESIVVAAADSIGNYSIRRALVSFDITPLISLMRSLPDNNVVNASMVLFIADGKSNNDTPGMILQISTVSQDWGEGDVVAANPQEGAPADVGDATWIDNFYGRSAWRCPGGAFPNTPSASTYVTSAENQGFTWTSQTMVDDITGWIESPTSNHGWIVHSADESVHTPAIQFYSREASAKNYRPQLHITIQGESRAFLDVQRYALIAVGVGIGMTIATTVVFYMCKNCGRRRFYTVIPSSKLDIVRARFSVADLYKLPGVEHVRYEEIIMGKQLGRGAFAEVFLAEWKKTPVAVKKLSLSFPTDSRDLQKFQQEFVDEIKIMSSCKHPNLLSVLATSISPVGDCILITEYVEEGSLTQIIFSDRELPPFRQKSIATDIASGMQYLHSLTPAILHRDLKPDNVRVFLPHNAEDIAQVLIDRNWTCKIADFGLSRAIEKLNKTMTIRGTPWYMAPEGMEGSSLDNDINLVIQNGKFSVFSDVWSFGILFWELAARKQAYAERNVKSPFQMMMEVANDNVRIEIPSAWPSKCAELIKACVATQPEERPTFNMIIDRFKDMNNSDFDFKAQFIT